MLQLTKTIHVLSLGLWFGSVVFFTWVVALVIFQSFESLADKGADRPAWLGDSFDKDKASQLAGLAVGPIFHWYFLLQGVCGFLAIATALAWTRSEAGRKVHKLRFYILTGALITVLAGWPLAQKVSALRAARYAADAAVAAAAKTDFVSWHLYSLLLNQVTLLLVAVAMALAANLPSSRGAAAVNGEGCEPLDSKRL